MGDAVVGGEGDGSEDELVVGGVDERLVADQGPDQVLAQESLESVGVGGVVGVRLERADDAE